MTRILVVDDDPHLRRALQITLRGHGYEVTTAEDGRHALAATADEHPDLVVLDLGLPDIDGIDVIRRLRSWTPVPVLILSGRLESSSKVHALDAGATDYVTKPFHVEELLARVRAATRRYGTLTDPGPVRIGRYLVDVTAHRAEPATGVPGPEDGARPAVAGPVRLTPTEWHILQILVSRAGRLVTQQQLLEEVWGPTYLHETGYLRQYMKSLRRKLEEQPSAPRHLLTETGIGYRFEP